MKIISDVMTTKEVMEYLKISRATLWRLTRKKRMPFYRFSSRLIRFRCKDIDRWIKSQKWKNNKKYDF